MSDLLKVSYLKHGLKLSLRKEVSRKDPRTPTEFLKVAQEEENLDYSMAASIKNWEISSKDELQAITNVTTQNSPRIQENDDDSYPQTQAQHDSDNYYARVTTTYKQHRSQQQPYLYQHHQQQQPYLYQHQQQPPYVYQHQQQSPYTPQQQQSYRERKQQRCYICNKSGNFARNCWYSKNY
ncbi:unnamed protein product [Rotaria sp. Silwood2]|nr:unnamed protein product [Rotaria sp. Silwood2]CAF3099260.1 unnamed protein product [Rotaria sp. Silwood2]CAF3339005.1 unnamed protein product [Rotaria sp. Silwood2]CAF3454307.1 unnamed protein product [Rotaria sp. Silwood2]CAF4396730.1 unnamed protein product [Rotaria sp. Silwood2]